MKVHRTLDIHFPYSGWNMHITRHKSKVRIALHWGDKKEPTHEYMTSAKHFLKTLTEVLDVSKTSNLP